MSSSVGRFPCRFRRTRVFIWLFRVLSGGQSADRIELCQQMALQGTSDSSSSLSFPSPPAPLHLPPGWDEECQSLNGNHFLSEVVPSGRGSAAEPGVVSGRTGLDSADEFDTGASIYASHRPDFNIHISIWHASCVRRVIRPSRSCKLDFFLFILKSNSLEMLCILICWLERLMDLEDEGWR